MFENRVLRRVFGPKRDEVTGEWKKSHNEKFSDLYSLPNIVREVKSRRMRWVGHVARMGNGRAVHRFLVGNQNLESIHDISFVKERVTKTGICKRLSKNA